MYQPPLLPNGEIDYSKVDVHNDFIHFPALFSSADDIRKFIDDHNVDVPILKEFLKACKADRFNLSDIEYKFYLDTAFRYIYDVFRIPCEYTWGETAKWLGHVEDEFIFDGINHFIKESYEYCYKRYYKAEWDIQFPNKTRKADIINFYAVIAENGGYYDSTDVNLIEQFWIRTTEAGQPVGVADKEYYMRVNVFTDHVYIFGCDDCSYTFKGESELANKIFAHYLKIGAPIWNFEWFKLIHPELEFSN